MSADEDNAASTLNALFKPAQSVRELARQVAAELHLPADWLNDGVEGFVSSRHETTAQNLPQFAHLRVTMPVPEYLLAMKCCWPRLWASAGSSRMRISAPPPSIGLRQRMTRSCVGDGR